MRFDSRTAEVMRKAARGPALIALRQSRLTRPMPVNPRASILTRGGHVGMMPVARNVRGLNGLGATGPSGTTQAEDSAKRAAVGVGSSAAGAAIGAQIGTAAFPIVGTAIGAVVGIIAGMLLKKNYLNVADMNAHEDAEVAIWKQYQSIMGKVPGRALGLEAMTAIAKGMLHSGAGWTRNNVKQCFHNGCSKFPGNASWIDALVAGGGRADPDTFPVAIRSFKPTNGVPAAKSFIDNVVIPVNKAHNTWVVPSNNNDRTVLYDLADAYLAKVMPGTIPYTVNAPAPAIQTVPQPVNIVPSRDGAAGASSTGGGGAGAVATSNGGISYTTGATGAAGAAGATGIISKLVANPLSLILAGIALYKEMK